jgi:glutamyl-tRNA synthetase
MSVVVRIPPSPTGNLHLGSAYTFLFNHLYSKKEKGKLILRFEDTDLERSKKEFEENITDGLKWLGITWDEGPFRQTERLKSYEASRDLMLKNGSAYYCFCTPEELEKERKGQQEKKQSITYSGKCRTLEADEVKQRLDKGAEHVIRYKMPEDRGQISWKDLIHGESSFDSKLIGDFVIFRSTGFPIYNFAVVVDDIDMKVTHVLRGDDHLSNTPKQIVLFEALGGTLPSFAHWPNILNPDRIGKLSKRDNSTAVTDYRKDGFLPEAIVNYLAILGWTPPGDREIWSMKELEEAFDLSKMRKSPAAFDMAKLEWFNGEYLRALSDEELTQRLEDYLVDHPKKELIANLLPLLRRGLRSYLILYL